MTLRKLFKKVIMLRLRPRLTTIPLGSLFERLIWSSHHTNAGRYVLIDCVLNNSLINREGQMISGHVLGSYLALSYLL